MTFSSVITATMAMLLAACGSHQFSSQQPNPSAIIEKKVGGLSSEQQEGQNSPPAEELSQGNQLVSINPEVVFDQTPEGQALKACFREWGETPFNEYSAKGYRTLTTTNTGFGAVEVSDRTRTAQPSLVLVRINVQGFSTVEIDLGNPHGWYCIMSTAKGFTSLHMHKHCRATIGNFSSQVTGFGQSRSREYGDDC